jgi:NAD(P)-dependent dehydrogenase (short-subunit alcohol dehydrogenase family)
MPVPLPFLGGFLYRQLIVTPPIPRTRFDNKTVIVTGSNVGLGLEAARHFGRLGAARIILAVRDLTKGEVAKESIDQTLGVSPSPISVWKLDLASYDSVQGFSARVYRELDRVDVICENAGIATGNFRLAGMDETTITVNVVSAFLLAFLLLPKLKETAESYKTSPVITFTSSEVVCALFWFSTTAFPLEQLLMHMLQHNFTSFAEKNEPDIFGVLSDRSTANMLDRYFVSKLLQLLCVREMASNAGPSYPVTINCLNPGFVHSELAREAGWYLYTMGILFARSTEVGSRTIVAAAGGGPETHGKYMSESLVIEPSEFVRSEEGASVQKRVWAELVARLETIVPGVTQNL